MDLLTVRAFCCPDIPCYVGPVLLPGKDSKMRVYSKASVMVVQLGLQLIS